MPDTQTQTHAGLVPAPGPSPQPQVPDSYSAHSCLQVPQTPPHPGAPGPERGSLWGTHFLGRCPVPHCPALPNLRPHRKGGEERGEEEAGKSRGAGHEEGNSLWQTGQKQGPGEGCVHRAGGHGFFWQLTEPSWGETVIADASHLTALYSQTSHVDPWQTPDSACQAQAPALAWET